MLACNIRECPMDSPMTGPGPTPGQPMAQAMQMHQGVSGPNGPVSQAGPMMAGMQPGMGPSAHPLQPPSAMGGSHQGQASPAPQPRPLALQVDQTSGSHPLKTMSKRPRPAYMTIEGEDYKFKNKLAKIGSESSFQRGFNEIKNKHTISEDYTKGVDYMRRQRLAVLKERPRDHGRKYVCSEIKHEREVQPRLESQQDHDNQARFQAQHSRRISQEFSHQRRIQGNAPSAAQIISQMLSVSSSASSPETRPISSQHLMNVPQMQTATQSSAEPAGQPPSAMAVAQHTVSRPTVVTPPVKEEPRHYPLPPQAPPIFAYSNPQTPSELHPAHSAHQHIQGQSIAEQYRAQNSRYHEFDARNRKHDVGRELSRRADALHESLLSNSQHRATAAPVPPHQDLRYQTHPQQDRGYGHPRSHTPLSRYEHPQHPSLQHPHHSLLVDNNHVILGQRQQDDPTTPQHRLRDAYPPRDERERLADRIREEQAHQQARMRYRESTPFSQFSDTTPAEQLETNPDSSTNSTPPPGAVIEDPSHGLPNFNPHLNTVSMSLQLPNGLASANSYEVFDPLAWMLDAQPE
ncbi:hypothetical protein K469DRAFT_681878 [Zopfia rhizophila CBS 207.26]|uniref:Uncharacterized protein n=1 Tax=Zopfia rhizophila CBS 207.26 TaxID=1314779 RepID=A0A6A6F0C7_9PEZI|nr:hypothetical protein K469DRAFT_681878 [Zopfia rhizophila CBS 207.26]